MHHSNGYVLFIIIASLEMLNANCPLRCNCVHSQISSGKLEVECLMSEYDFPIICRHNWISLHVTLKRLNSTSVIDYETHSIILNCENLESLELTNDQENIYDLRTRIMFMTLINLKRVWLKNIYFNSDFNDVFRLFAMNLKLEFIAISNSNLSMDDIANLITDVPQSMRQLRITDANLSGKLKRCSFAQFCRSNRQELPNLVRINLSGNKISSLDTQSLLGCKSVQVLKLSRNSLSGSLEDILGIHYDQANVGALAVIPKVRTLDFSGNQILGIRGSRWSVVSYDVQGKATQSLQYLTRLIFSNNNLRFLGVGAFDGVPNLKELDLTRNPTLSSPVDPWALNSVTLLTGILPSVFRKLHNLQRILNEKNSFTCLLHVTDEKQSLAKLNISYQLIEYLKTIPLCKTKSKTKDIEKTKRITRLPKYELKNNDKTTSSTVNEEKDHEVFDLTTFWHTFAIVIVVLSILLMLSLIFITKKMFHLSKISRYTSNNANFNDRSVNTANNNELSQFNFMNADENTLNLRTLNPPQGVYLTKTSTSSHNDFLPDTLNLEDNRTCNLNYLRGSNQGIDFVVSDDGTLLSCMPRIADNGKVNSINSFSLRNERHNPTSSMQRSMELSMKNWDAMRQSYPPNIY